jgi:hypothetical protein
MDDLFDILIKSGGGSKAGHKPKGSSVIPQA